MANRCEEQVLELPVHSELLITLSAHMALCFIGGRQIKLIKYTLCQWIR